MKSKPETLQNRFIKETFAKKPHVKSSFRSEEDRVRSYRHTHTDRQIFVFIKGIRCVEQTICMQAVSGKKITSLGMTYSSEEPTPSVLHILIQNLRSFLLITFQQIKDLMKLPVVTVTSLTYIPIF